MDDHVLGCGRSRARRSRSSLRRLLFVSEIISVWSSLRAS